MHTEYPRHLHKAGGAYLVVQDDAGKAAAIEAGWSLTPVLDAPVSDEAKDAATEQSGEGDAPKKDAPKKPRAPKKPKAE